MLVIASDLHLTDGTTGATLAPEATALFADRVRELAHRASQRSDGSYRPLERVDLLFLGDLLDPLRSTQWLSDSVRPWSPVEGLSQSDVLSKIVDRIVTENESSLAALRSLAAPGGLRVPRAAKPAADDDGEPVATQLHYMVGNHDWFFHHPDPYFHPLRGKVIEAMGLCQAAETPFPHDMLENEELARVLRRHKVLARHGDVFDPLNFDGDRATSSLGDAIVVELVTRFPAAVAARLGEQLPPTALAGLREIDNLRPIVLAPVWIDGLLERSCTPALRKQVKAVWDELVDLFLSLEFVRAHDRWHPFEVVDGLARILKFSKRLSVEWASSLTAWLYGLRGARSPSYGNHALAESDFRSRRARHLVYGHTHLAECVPLDASNCDGRVLEQIYFNAGTWRRVYRPTQFNPAEHEFIAADEMTYLVFYQGDERGGRPFETWTGTLGQAWAASPAHRLDATQARLAGPHGADAASEIAAAPPAPHFTSAASRVRLGLPRLG